MALDVAIISAVFCFAGAMLRRNVNLKELGWLCLTAGLALNGGLFFLSWEAAEILIWISAPLTGLGIGWSIFYSELEEREAERFR